MRVKKKKEVTHRIPFANWRNSQLSIARFYGGCKLNGKDYVLDYDNAPTKITDGKTEYFPDLITYD